MPLPNNPLVIWAEDNVNLPDTGKPNKAVPQESLRKIGWDVGQKPSCEEFNYILNNMAQYIQYYGIEKTKEFLVKANNLSDLTNTATARNNLDVYDKSTVDSVINTVTNNLNSSVTTLNNKITSLSTEVNNKRIDTGAGLTGGGDLSANRTISLNSVTPCISILTGVLDSGGTIPLPAGYNESQCKWIVSVNELTSGPGSSEIDTFECKSAGRVISVFANSPDGINYGKANYIIIGIK